MVLKISLYLFNHFNRQSALNTIKIKCIRREHLHFSTTARRRRRSYFTADRFNCKMSSNPATTPPTTTSIEIRVAQDQDHDRLLDFLRTHYYNEEPLTIGIEPKQQDPADEEFNMSNLKHGTCLMALRRNQCHEEEVIGGCVAGPKDPSELEHLMEDYILHRGTKWGEILKLLACIERNANVFERYGVKCALHCHALGVHRNARGLSLGQRMIEEILALGRRRHFQVFTVDCTSIYSARICERLGMDCINEIRFDDYKDERGNQIFKPPPPHDVVKTFAQRLND